MPINNISREHFQNILLPNTQNDDILNIFLFYRKNIFVEDSIFQEYLNSIDYKSLIKRLFAISPNSTILNNIQKEIASFDFDKNFSNEEIAKIKWLLFDRQNSNGNFVSNITKSEYQNNSCKLLIYFTDISVRKKLNKYTDGWFSFYENENPNKVNVKRYLKFNYINENNNKQFLPFHFFIMKNYADYKKDPTKFIDHIQKAPKYFYDFNYSSYVHYFLSLNNTKEEKIKNIIYSRIIDSWYNNISPEILTNPQFNNCFYNLKELNTEVNSSVKAYIIDKRNDIYPHRDINSKTKFYVTFYLPNGEDLKVGSEIKHIVALTILYNLRKIDYEGIIQEIKEHCTTNNQLNINKLFEYIKGKDIFYMPEINNNVSQKAIIDLRGILNGEMQDMIFIENYQ